MDIARYFVLNRCMDFICAFKFIKFMTLSNIFFTTKILLGTNPGTRYQFILYIWAFP